VGQNARATIAYGIPFEEDQEFPWDEAPFDGDVEEWWRTIKGYKLPFEMFDSKGDWLPGFEKDKEKCDEYYKHRREWLENNPVPVAVLTMDSYDASRYFIAALETEVWVDWGEHKEIVLNSLNPLKKHVNALNEFVAEYLSGENFDIEDAPKWHLFAFYG